MFRQLIRRALGRVLRTVFSPSSWLASQVVYPPRPLVKLGTQYGGWSIVEISGDISKKFAILCGAGEDVSFDLALQRQYDLNCIIVDPTPRAIRHFSKLCENVANGIDTPINNSGSEFYDVQGVDFKKITYKPVAVWTKREKIKFWKPANDAHVSFSAANIQQTNEFIEVDALPLEEIIDDESDNIELIKLDIEGIGAKIAEALIARGLRPNQILLEFEEVFFPTKSSVTALKRAVRTLQESGYSLVHFDGLANCVFYRN